MAVANGFLALVEIRNFGAYNGYRLHNDIVLAKNHLLAILEVDLTLDGTFNLTSEEVVDDACVAALQRCSFDSRLSVGRNYKEVIDLELACATRLIQSLLHWQDQDLSRFRHRQKLRFGCLAGRCCHCRRR